VRVIVNGEEKIIVNKESSEPESLDYSKDDNKTPSEMFELDSIITRNIKMTIDVKELLNLNNLESIKLTTSKFKLTQSIKVTTGKFKANLTEKEKKEMERITKKKPPKIIDISILRYILLLN